jgi:hypothetical protein
VSPGPAAAVVLEPKAQSAHQACIDFFCETWASVHPGKGKYPFAAAKDGKLVKDMLELVGQDVLMGAMTALLEKPADDNGYHKHSLLFLKNHLADMQAIVKPAEIMPQMTEIDDTHLFD